MPPGHSRSDSQKKTVVVLGNAKSGTSLVAGILHILGVNMGRKFVEADDFNPRGYFEDYDFVNLTDAIFKEAKSNYWNFPSYETLMAQRDKFGQRIQRLLRKKEKNQRIWGWKDPWTNILIELFLPYLTNPFFIVIFRNTLAIAKSSVSFTRAKRHEFWVQHPITLFHGMKLANFYDRILLEFFEAHPKLPLLFVAFEDILDDSTKEAKRIARFLNIVPSKWQIDRIRNFTISRDQINEERKRFNKYNKTA